jgi:membrane associated rhomboid family serine protease
MAILMGASLFLLLFVAVGWTIGALGYGAVAIALALAAGVVLVVILWWSRRIEKKEQP